MKKVVTLTESELIRLVKKVIAEQTAQPLADQIISLLGNTYKFKVTKRVGQSTILVAPPAPSMKHNIQRYEVRLVAKQNAAGASNVEFVVFEKIPAGEVNSPMPKMPFKINKRITDFKTINDFKAFFDVKFWDGE